MPSIIYRKNEKNGITYAYESVSYWDKEKKQPRSMQKYLGKVDPETGEIIPKKDKAAAKKQQLAASDSEEVRELLQENKSLLAECEVLRTQNATLIKENEDMLSLIRSMKEMLSVYPDE